jgi:hypothetical protein
MCHHEHAAVAYGPAVGPNRGRLQRPRHLTRSGAVGAACIGERTMLTAMFFYVLGHAMVRAIAARVTLRRR